MSDYNNRMQSRGKIIGSSSSSLDVELGVHLQKYDYLDCEMEIIPLYKNNATGQVEVVKIEFPTIRVIPDNDAYVKDTIPFFSYYEMASLPNGEITGEKYESFMTFNDLTKLDIKVTKKIAEAKLILFKDLNTSINTKIELYDLDKTFTESNISYLSHPNCRKKLADSKFNVKTNSFEFDITKYVKNVTKMEDIHTGFGFNSDLPFVLSSSNSMNKPYIEIKYIPDDLFGSSSYMDTETKILNVSTIDAECKFEDQYPKLDVECIVSRESIENTLNFKMQNSMDIEMGVRSPDQFNSIETELLFSKNNIEANMFLASLKEMDVNMTLYKPELDFMETELEIQTVSHRTIETDIAFSSSIETDFNLIPKSLSEIDCELLITKPEINTEVDIIPLYSDNLDIETNLLKKYNYDNMDIEFNISKDSIESNMYILPVSKIDAEVDILFEDKIDAECMYKVTDFEQIECENDLKFPSSIDTEMNFVTSDNSLIDVESSVILKGNTGIDIENKVIFIGNSFKEVDLDLIFNSKLDAEFIYRESAKSDMDIETGVALVGESDLEIDCDIIFNKSIDAEFIYRESAKSDMDIETGVIFTGESDMDIDCDVIFNKSIDAEFSYVIPGDSHISIETDISFIGDSNINTELNLIFNKSIDTELVLLQNKKSNMELEMILDKDGSIPMECELNLSIQDQNQIDTQLNLLVNESTDLETELEIVLKNNINNIIIIEN